MLVHLVFAISDTTLEKHLTKTFGRVDDVRVEAYGQSRAAWQKAMRSGADIICISESLIPKPVDTGIFIMNDLPETPTSVILHDSDAPEEHARLLTAGADVALYSGLSRKDLTEAIETVLGSRRQISEMIAPGYSEPNVPRIDDFLRGSDHMKMFIEEVRQVISSHSPLLLLGETGVGKEHLARAIHAEGSRSKQPFIAINMAALPEPLLESELFGHAQGAFTGAVRSRRGAFELAHRGTLFLDEMGEMPLHLQTKLLRVLQDYCVRPVGSERSINVDARVIAATNSDLEEQVRQGAFRKDLYYRLNVITLTIPPLRQRREDIPHMAKGFIDFFRYRIGRDVDGITDEAMEALCRYDWPGNTRELMNVIERGILLCRGNRITPGELPAAFTNHLPDRGNGSFNLNTIGSWEGKTLREVQDSALRMVERRYLEMVLKQTRGRVGEAARIAGIHTRSLYNKMKQLELDKRDFKQSE